MFKQPITIMLILLISSLAQAESRHEACIKEEKVLKAQEAGDCNGMKYLLNPSGCFATRKKLKGQAEKCAELARLNMNVTPPAVPESAKVDQPAATVYSPVRPATTARTPAVPHPAALPNATQSAPAARNNILPALSTTTCEQLKVENARLKSEIERLKSENERLKKTVN